MLSAFMDPPSYRDSDPAASWIRMLPTLLDASPSAPLTFRRIRARAAVVASIPE
jgi:hypothetical protein